MNNTDQFTHIRLVRPGEVEGLTRESNADGSILLLPTHVVTREGLVVGTISMGVIPMALVWMHSQRGRRRDSLAVATFIEDRAHDMGARFLATPCPKQSPLHPYMERIGYSSLSDNVSLFVKGIS